MLNHIGQFGSPEVIHADQGPAFHYELVQELNIFFATAYSSEENGIVERANQEVLRNWRALLFDSSTHHEHCCEDIDRSHSSGFDTHSFHLTDIAYHVTCQ
jgi:hypothetical protein